LSESTIKEAAQRLGVTETTIRRRIHDGHLHAHQQERPQGFTWIVELDEDPDLPPHTVENNPTPHHHPDPASREVEEALRDTIKRQDEAIEQLRTQLEARTREIQELHVLVQQAQTALPAPKENRRWWRFW